MDFVFLEKYNYLIDQKQLSIHLGILGHDGITKITMVTNTVIKMKAIDQQFKTLFDVNKMV